MNEKNNKIKLTVVISSRDHEVTVNPHQTVEQLVREALRDSGNEGQPVDNWELKKSDGSVVPNGARIQDTGITDGSKLYLSPKAGTGGF